MENCYCKKCGLRALTKCPTSRSIFPRTGELSSPHIFFLENFVKVKATPSGGDTDDSRRYEVSFWTYDSSDEEALGSIMRSLFEAMRSIDEQVLGMLSCIHEWELLPGERCDIHKDHVGPEAEVPPDPLKKEDRTDDPIIAMSPEKTE